MGGGLCCAPISCMMQDNALFFCASSTTLLPKRGRQRYFCATYGVGTTGPCCCKYGQGPAALAFAENLLEMQTRGPTLDLLTHNLPFKKTPGDSYPHYSLRSSDSQGNGDCKTTGLRSLSFQPLGNVSA